MKAVFVVSGACFAFDPASTPTRSWRAAGLAVRKERSSWLDFPVVSLFSVLEASTVEMIDFSWDMTVSFRAHSSCKARLSFFVSRSFLRCAWTVSGVGAFGEFSKERPCNPEYQCQPYQLSEEDRRSQLMVAYLVMFELHPRKQILGDGEDVSQHVDLEFIKRFVDIGFKKSLQLVQSILDLKFRFRVDDVSILVGLMNDRPVTVVGKPQPLWGSINETRFETGDRLVDQVVD